MTAHSGGRCKKNVFHRIRTYSKVDRGQCYLDGGVEVTGLCDRWLPLDGFRDRSRVFVLDQGEGAAHETHLDRLVDKRVPIDAHANNVAALLIVLQWRGGKVRWVTVVAHARRRAKRQHLRQGSLVHDLALERSANA